MNIGGGKKDIPGYVNIDRIHGREIFPLPDIADNSVEEIYASHVLEHLPRAAVAVALHEYHRVLKPGGRIRIGVPDGEYWSAELLKGRGEAVAYLHGGQNDENDYHMTLFTNATLRHALARHGFAGIKTFEPEYADCTRIEGSLNLEAFKLPAVTPWKSRRIVGVMSTNRLGFSHNFHSISSAIYTLGIPVRSFVSGANWGQNLERAFEWAIEQDAEWILTFDFDTVFTIDAIQRLMILFELHPEYAALTPLQAKRECSELLACFPENVNLKDLDGAQVMDILTSHFGMSLLRVDALKKMPKPWFHHKPAPDGSWNEGRTDDDIGFWKSLRACGFRLGLAPHVGIGHAQLMYSWMTDDFKIVHQHINDYSENGPPAHVRR